MGRGYLFRVKFKKMSTVSNQSESTVQRQMEVRGRGRESADLGQQEPHMTCVTNIAYYQLP